MSTARGNSSMKRHVDIEQNDAIIPADIESHMMQPWNPFQAATFNNPIAPNSPQLSQVKRRRIIIDDDSQ